MFELIEKTTDKDHIRFHLIPSKKFKTVNIVVKCKTPLHRSTITKRALLPYILQQGTKDFPSEKQLMLQLDELYGATLSIDGTKKGNNHIISFRLEVANEKFIHDESTVIDEGLQLLHNLIYAPYLEENTFPEKTVEREKITLKHKINSIYDDKLAYANMRLIDEMCQDEIFHIHPNGYEEDLEAIQAADMYKYYEQLLQEDRMDLYILGDFHVEEMGEKITNIFKRKQYVQSDLELSEEKVNRNEPKEVVEVQDIQQAKLHIGYRTNCTYQDEDYFALHIFNGLFGGFPNAKLFKNVREKHSLAYYASSRIESHKGLLIIFSGIESTNYQQARDIIELQMKAMKEGDFTKSEMEETKELIISEIQETLDHPQGIIELLYQQVIAQKEISPAQFIENIQKVTKEEIVKVAKKIDLDTVYLLTNKEGGGKDGKNDV